MANNKQPQTDAAQKAKTKYDRKMEERKKQEAKDKRKAKIMQIAAIIIGVAIIAAIVISVVASIWNKNKALNTPYVTIGNYEITEPEYNYYYSATVNNYMATYSPILSYIGLDPSVSFDEQQYTEDMTWKDMFDALTIEQIKQTKIMIDDAAANQFTYDDTDKYANIISTMKADAEAKSLPLSNYYKTTYGPYATEKVLEPFIKEGILAAGYYEELIKQNVPTEQEIKDYYAEHVIDYDKVDYRSFTFTADVAEGAAEEEIDKAMLEIKKKAEAMMEARQGGADFKELCLENASEDLKATYEDTEKDASINEAKSYAGLPDAIADWMFEDGRTEGDIAVLEDTEGHQYYVVEFINRYYDEADDENISNVIAGERVKDYIAGLAKSYNVTDNSGDLKYLTIDMTAGTEEETAEDVIEDALTEEVNVEETDTAE